MSTYVLNESVTTCKYPTATPAPTLTIRIYGGRYAGNARNAKIISPIIRMAVTTRAERTMVPNDGWDDRMRAA